MKHFHQWLLTVAALVTLNAAFAGSISKQEGQKAKPVKEEDEMAVVTDPEEGECQDVEDDKV